MVKSREEEIVYFSNSSCVMWESDEWSMVSMNETAPI